MFFHVIDLKSVKGLQIFEQPDCANGGYQDACIALLRSYRGADADTVSLSDNGFPIGEQWPDTAVHGSSKMKG